MARTKVKKKLKLKETTSKVSSEEYQRRVEAAAYEMAEKTIKKQSKTGLTRKKLKRA